MLIGIRWVNNSERKQQGELVFALKCLGSQQGRCEQLEAGIIRGLFSHISGRSIAWLQGWAQLDFDPRARHYMWLLHGPHAEASQSRQQSPKRECSQRELTRASIWRKRINGLFCSMKGVKSHWLETKSFWVQGKQNPISHVIGKEV